MSGTVRVKLIYRNYRIAMLQMPENEPVVKFIGHGGKVFQYDGIGHGMVHQYREVSRRVANNVSVKESKNG
jgi:hypothetical protein